MIRGTPRGEGGFLSLEPTDPEAEPEIVRLEEEDASRATVGPEALKTAEAPVESPEAAPTKEDIDRQERQINGEFNQRRQEFESLRIEAFPTPGYMGARNGYLDYEKNLKDAQSVDPEKGELTPEQMLALEVKAAEDKIRNEEDQAREKIKKMRADLKKRQAQELAERLKRV